MAALQLWDWHSELRRTVEFVAGDVSSWKGVDCWRKVAKTCVGLRFVYISLGTPVFLQKPSPTAEGLVRNERKGGVSNSAHRTKKYYEKIFVATS